MFGRTKSGASASENQNAPKSLGLSPRRIKEMAKLMKPFVEKARLEGMPSEREGLDFVAGLFGFESYQAACAMPEPFAIEMGQRRVRRQKDQPWMVSSQELLGGALLLGSTGAGKTEALMGMAVAALEKSPGLGLLWVDGKGEFVLMAKWREHMKALGRESDARFLDLMGALPWASPPPRPTHRFDPMFGMDPCAVADWLERSLGEKLLDVGPSKDLGDEREARELMRAVLTCWALDARSLRADPAQDPGVASLAAAAALPERGEAAGESGWAKAWRLRLSLLLENPQARLAAKAMKTRAMEPIVLMLDHHPEAFRSERDESGAWLEPHIRPDAPLMGQACFVALPALEKSPDQLGDLGRMVCCSFECAFNSAPPEPSLRALAVLDEFGYYGPEPDALMLSARRAGVGLVLAAQDLWACQGQSWRQGLSPKVLSALGAARLKIFMKAEDSSREYQDFVKAAFAPMDPPPLLDLRDQREGEAWVPGVGRARLAHRPAPQTGPFALPWVKTARRSQGD